MSTRQETGKRLFGTLAMPGRPGGLPSDIADTVGLVARSRRDLLLAAHRHRLGHEDLEDCYGQATLELLVRARRGGEFVNRAHIGNALEQKFLSRIHDRRRALGGRSPIAAALAGSSPIGSDCHGSIEIADGRADLERLVLARDDLRRIACHWRELSSDQRLVLASQLWDEMDCAEFCRTHGWSAEKYRKVAQRARARLAGLLAAESLTGKQSAGSSRPGVSRGASRPAGLRVPLAGARRTSEQGHTYEHSSPPT